MLTSLARRLRRQTGVATPLPDPASGQPPAAELGAQAGAMLAAGSVRRFRAAHDPEDLDDLAGLPTTLPDDELLWVDLPSDASAVRAADEHFGLVGLLAAMASRSEPGFEQREGALGLSLIGLADRPHNEANGPPRAADQKRSLANGRRGVANQAHGPSPLMPVRFVASRNLVISVHDGEVAGLTSALEQHTRDRRLARLDAGTFLGLLLEGILSGYYDELERLERRIDDVDELALRGDGGQRMLDELLELRRWIARLRRSLARQRDVFAALARPVGDPSHVGTPWPELATRLDHLVSSVEQARESLLGSFDLLMTRAAQQSNEVMRTLTVLSSVLLPAVVIAGIMGMNFPTPFFADPDNIFPVLALMAALAIGTLAVARLRGWI